VKALIDVLRLHLLWSNSFQVKCQIDGWGQLSLRLV